MLQTTSTRNRVELYALAVCWASTMAFIAFSGWCVLSVVQVAAPAITMRSWNYQIHQSNDQYWDYQGRSKRYDTGGTRVRPAEETLTQERLASFTEQLAYERRDGLRALVNAASFLLVTLVVFAGHWILGRRARRQGGNASLR